MNQRGCRALAAYAAEHSLVQLIPHQIDITNKIIAALSPIEELTTADTAACYNNTICLIIVQVTN